MQRSPTYFSILLPVFKFVNFKFIENHISVNEMRSGVLRNARLVSFF